MKYIHYGGFGRMQSIDNVKGAGIHASTNTVNHIDNVAKTFGAPEVASLDSSTVGADGGTTMGAGHSTA